jgi:hypothetical protein
MKFETCPPSRTLSHPLANKSRFAAILTYLGKRARNQIFISLRVREGLFIAEGRRKKEEGRRKKEEGRRKKEELLTLYKLSSTLY